VSTEPDVGPRCNGCDRPLKFMVYVHWDEELCDSCYRKAANTVLQQGTVAQPPILIRTARER
jgi:recombinational DNA repair protein (RecF pathway)